MDERGVEGCIDVYQGSGARKLGGCKTQWVGISRSRIEPDGGAHVGGPFERFEELTTEFEEGKGVRERFVLEGWGLGQCLVIVSITRVSGLLTYPEEWQA